MRTAESIASEIRSLLERAGEAKLDQLLEHFRRLQMCKEDLEKQVARLGRRKGFDFYARVGALHSDRLLIDVRVAGTSCGEIALVPGKNSRLFRPKKRYRDRIAGGPADWGRESVRKYLKEVASLVHRQREAAVENALLLAMWKGKSVGELKSLYWHQPVLLANMPFQFPLPISARGQFRLPHGSTAGHADVIARSSRGVRVFEVKKPRASDVGHALDQAVAYCAALEYLLDRDRETICAALGYNKVRINLPIDAVAFVEDTPRNRLSVERAAGDLSKDSRFGLAAQFYRWADHNGRPRLVIEPERRYSTAK
jgi:hypothetical protein